MDVPKDLFQAKPLCTGITKCRFNPINVTEYFITENRFELNNLIFFMNGRAR
jgi:hypothetical protein